MNEAAPAPPQRKIIHVDMDAFYASVEQRDDPALRGKPVAVGGQVRGVVAAASYEARRYGVRSAMPSVTAKRRCPDLIFVKPRFDAYRAVSQQIRAIFADYTAAGRAALPRRGLSRRHRGSEGNRHRHPDRARRSAPGSAPRPALTASAGVSYNKFIAKLASDQNKPDGLCVVPPAKGEAFVAALPVKRFHGIGPKTAEKMARPRHRHRRRPARAEPRLPDPQFRQLGRLLLQPRPRHLPPPGQAQPALQVDRRRGHLPRGPDRRGGPDRRARPDQPDRLAPHRREGDQRPDGDAQGQVSATSRSSPAPGASTAPSPAARNSWRSASRCCAP